ncbi:hypothetical protein NE237_029565 [Protea cynaroides]|uniref:Uncharacterized protein n=1 Tax=Protea cynaroides TaxID=273540 RepID=A0A9Q0GU49_9MAGN|nr:hypothetical protein NE237_029565 [Protea cynaroides]
MGAISSVTMMSTLTLQNLGIVLGSPSRTTSVSTEETKKLDSVGPLGDLPVVAIGTGGINPQSSKEAPHTGLSVFEGSGHCVLANLMVERVKTWDAERSGLLQQNESIAQYFMRERESTITERRKVFEEREKIAKEKKRDDQKDKRIEEVEKELERLKQEKSSLEIKLEDRT